MALAKPNQITVPFASSGVKNTIPETATGSNLASMQEGFPTVTMTDVDQGGMPPQGQDMNGILFDVTKAIQYQQAGGLFPFDATFASKIDGYPIGALLTSADGTKIFQNMIDGNQSDPENGGQNWNEILTSTAIAGKQDKLTPAQMNAVNSGITAAKVAQYDGYATGKQDTLTFDNTPTEGSLNPVTSDGIATSLSLKQDNITVDAVPTSGSTNPVQSGGVYDALAEKVDIDDAGNAEVTATGSTTARTLANRFADVINVRDYGAVGDGVTDDTVSIQAMISAEGYARFPKGDFLCSTTTLDAPLYFDVDGALTVSSGNTITITADIESPNQQIFKGDGVYFVGNDNDSGENARHLQASWFGIFPSSNAVVDVSAAMNKMMAAVGTGRESVIHFDIGRYAISSTVTLGRACHIQGAGIRNTVFTYTDDGYVMFDMSLEGCRLTHCQIEASTQTVLASTRSSGLITVSGGHCEILDFVINANAKNYITLTGDSPRVERIRCILPASTVISDSRAILVQSPQARIEDIRFEFTGRGLTYGIEIAGSTSKSIGDIIIRDVFSQWSSTAVHVVNTSSRNVNQVSIEGIYTNTSANTETAVQIENSGTGGILNLTVVDVNVLGNSIGVSANCSSGTLRRLMVDEVMAVSGNAVSLTRTGGSFNDVHVGDQINGQVVSSGTVTFDKSITTSTGVTATGSTTARTLANRFADVINVRDFGAKGDGVTDDYSAFYAAQQNFQTKGIYPFIPPGDYYLSAKVPGIFCYVTGVTLDPKKCYAVKITNPRDILNDNNIAFGQPTIFRWAFRFTDSVKKAAFIAKAQELKAYCANNNFTYGNWNTVPPSGTQIDCSAFIAWCLYEIGYTELANSDPNAQLLGSDGTFPAWFRSKTSDFTEILNIRGLEQGDIVFTGAKHDFSYATHVYMFWSYNTGYGMADATIGESGAVEHKLSALYSNGAFLTGLTRCIPENNRAGIIVKLDEDRETFRQLIIFEDSQIENATIFGGIENLGNSTSAYTNLFNRKGNVNAKLSVGFVSSDTTAGRLMFLPDGSNSMFTMRGNVCQIKAFLQPMTDNVWSCGTASLRWKDVYAVNDAIQTSDERLKDNISDISDDVLDAWGDVNLKVFQFKDALERKGDDARIHTGVIAQQVKSAFESRGLDAFRYGLLCYDEWDAQEEVWETQEIEHPPRYDEETGVVIEPAWTETVQMKVQEAMDAGDRYSIRYDEALILEAAYQRRRADRIEARLKAIEERIG